MLDTDQLIAPPRSDSPYPGLVPYGDRDAPFFFGREHERGIIAANLLASRLTLLYGASGVGKSSVLRAGVVHDIRRQATEQVAGGATPEFVVVEFATWRDDPIPGLESAVGQSVEHTLGEVIPDPPPTTRRLDRFLGTWAERLDADLLIILDQFEEYFLYHDTSDGEGTFAVEFPRAVNARDLRANFLLSIREDAVAKLDRFKGRIPNLFGNYLRIRHLDRDSGRAAIVKPLQQFNRLIPRTEPVTIEPELVERILDQVGTERVTVGQVGHGAIAETSGDVDRIETPYLQLVVSRLWDEEAEAGSAELRLETLQRLGGAQRIVRTHLDNAMEGKLSPQERDMAARVFRYLVTRSGSKIAHTAADLAEYAEVPEVALCGVLERLAGSDVRIIRSVAPPPGAGAPRYEIFHDVLAAAVLDWRARYEQRRRQADTERRLELEKGEAQEVARKARRRSRTFAALLGAAVLAVVGVLLLSLWALGQRDTAQSEAMVAEAVSELDIDPRESVRFALGAWRERNTDRAEAILREALSASRVRVVIPGHEKIVAMAEFSPYGTRVVTASGDGSARISTTATGSTLGVLQHGGEVTGAAFSPDGRYVVTTSHDDTARVWEAEDGEAVGGPLRHDAPVSLTNSDGFGEGGEYIATGPFSRDGRYLVTYAGDSAWIWEIGSGRLLHTLVHGRDVYSAAFSPDGESVMTAGLGGRVRIWNVQTGEMLFTMDNFTSWVNQALFSPDGSLVAAANSDGTVGIWKAATGRLVTWLFGHTDEVSTVAFSPDSRLLVTAGDKTARVWRRRSFSKAFSNELTVMGGLTSWVNTAVFSPDGQRVVTANQDGTGRVWDVRTGTELLTLRGHTDIVWSATFSPVFDQVLTASEDATARVWDVGSGVELRGHHAAVNAVAVSPEGDRVATAGLDGLANLWDARSGEAGPPLGGRYTFDPVNTAVFSRDGSRVITARESGHVVIWDARSDRRIAACCSKPAPRSSLEPKLPALGAEFSPAPGDDRVLVLYGDGSARVWDVSQGARGRGAVSLQEFGGLDEPIIVATFSPDGRYVATVGRSDRWLRLWDSTGEQIERPWPVGHVVSVAFGPHGGRVATGGTDGTVRVWNSETGEQIGSFQGSTGSVSSVAFSPDGRWIVAGGSDGTTRIWAVGSHQPLAVLRIHTDSVNSVAVTPDLRIVSGSDDQTAKIYSCDTCVSMREIEEMAERHLRLTDPGG